MKVTIVGAGNMGRGIGARSVAGGNDVEIVDRNPEDARALAEELGGAATAVEPGAPISGEVVVLALYYGSVPEAIEQLGDQLAGKVVVEISNPIDFDTMDRLTVPADSSAAEEAQKLVPGGTPVVKAFNTTFATTLGSGEKDGTPLDVVIAGDDDAAKDKVASLVEAGGMRAIAAGPLRRARQLEHAGFLNDSLQKPLDSGFGSALKFLS